MRRTIQTFAAFTLAASLFAAACSTKPPKQVESPDALADKGGADMSSGQDGSGNVAPAATGKSGEDQMRERCCGECKTALAKDRSGGAPNTIPCADFSDLSPVCLEHFRAKKAMASECK
jgi:hypothetical protein